MSLRSVPGVETRPKFEDGRTSTFFHTTKDSCGLQSCVSYRQASWPEASLRSVTRARPGSLPARGLSTAKAAPSMLLVK